MKRDTINRNIHYIVNGNANYPIGVGELAELANCSKPYAHKWLAHFADRGALARIRMSYKNMFRDFYCGNDQVERMIEMIEFEYPCETVLEVQELGKWIQCLTTE